MTVNIFSKFTILILLLVAVNESQCQTTAQKVASAIAEAKLLLESEMIKDEPGGGVDMNDHSYVKLTPTTEKIGLWSNINLVALDILTNREGMSRSSAISNLQLNMPSECSTPSLNCVTYDRYRTINGSCNNLGYPYRGTSFLPFNRLLPAEYSDSVNQPKGGRQDSTLPNPRLISSTVHRDLIQPDDTITNFVPIAGVFLDHDMTLTPEGDKHCCSGDKDTDCWSIPIFPNDTFYSRHAKTCMDFTRSTAYCFPGNNGIREQFNILTAYMDNSNVYGSDNKFHSFLREYQRGRLRVNKLASYLLPSVAEVEEELNVKIHFMGEFLAGDERVNEMPALTVMHMLFLREHNRLAAQIYNLMPFWSDQLIFEEARRLVIAQWQNVIYNEYLPVILGEATMNKYNLNLGTGYSTYNANIDATIFNSFATAAYRFGHTLLNGVVQLMRGMSQVGSYRLRDGFFASEIVKQNGGEGYELILNGLMQQNAQTYDQFVTEDVTNFLLREKMNNFGADLIARNLQRGRDHGIPSYSKFREVCGLPPLTTWDNRPREIRLEAWKLLSELYRSPNDIELFTGGISEFPVAGAVSGATFNCLKAIQFQRTKFGDRYFFTHQQQPGSFSTSQLANIRSRTLGDIICDNSQVQSTTLNVFRTSKACNGVANPWISCTDPRRNHLNIFLFVD